MGGALTVEGEGADGAALSLSLTNTEGMGSLIPTTLSADSLTVRDAALDLSFSTGDTTLGSVAYLAQIEGAVTCESSALTLTSPENENVYGISSGGDLALNSTNLSSQGGLLTALSTDGDLSVSGASQIDVTCADSRWPAALDVAGTFSSDLTGNGFVRVRAASTSTSMPYALLAQTVSLGSNTVLAEPEDASIGAVADPLDWNNADAQLQSIVDEQGDPCSGFTLKAKTTTEQPEEPGISDEPDNTINNPGDANDGNAGTNDTSMLSKTADPYGHAALVALVVVILAGAVAAGAARKAHGRD